jgi:hypothetical protein
MRESERATVGGESDRVKEQGESAEKPNAFESDKVKVTVGGASDRYKEQGKNAEKPNEFESEKVKEQQSEVKATERKSKERVQRSRMRLKARKWKGNSRR